jgi:hypothetical protein
MSESCREVIESCLTYKERDRREISDILNMKFFNRNRKTDLAIVEQFYEPETTFKT